MKLNFALNAKYIQKKKTKLILVLFFFLLKKKIIKNIKILSIYN